MVIGASVSRGLGVAPRDQSILPAEFARCPLRCPEEIFIKGAGATIGFASANLQFFERRRPYAFLNVETNWARSMHEYFKANEDDHNLVM
jgi:hypothetical protein